MYKDISSNMLDMIEPVAEAHGLEIVDATVKRGQGRCQVRIIVDTPSGNGKVTVDQCAGVSREISHGLDANDAIPGSYLLEVCSPGVDRVLARALDFERAVGSKVALETHEARDGRRRFRGQLVAFDEDHAHVRSEQLDVRIPLAAIARAKAFYPFDSPGVKR